MTGTKLRLLLIEDSESDAELPARVETLETLRETCRTEPWDIVISDYSMPELDGLAALRLVRERGEDIPFILTSGSIGEDRLKVKP